MAKNWLNLWKKNGQITAGIWTMICVVLGCTDGGAITADAPALVDDASAPADAGVSSEAAAPQADLGQPSGIGMACTSGSSLQGSCDEGNLCFPSLPGGYCTRFCGFDACPWDSVCTQNPSSGEICAKSCEADDDCRQDEGYRCNPSWRACVVPGFLSPVLKKCTSASALTRTSFGEVTQLSTSAGPGRYHTEVVAALNADGGVTAVFMARGQLGEDSGLGVSTLNADGTLNGDLPLSGSSKEIFDPWFATDRTGKIFLAYYGHDGFDANGVIGLVSSADGVTWSSEQIVHDPGDCAGITQGCLDKPMVAIGPRRSEPGEDAIYVFYFAELAGSMRMRRSVDGGKTFSVPTSVGTGAYGDAEVANDGSIHVTYVTGTPTPPGLGDTHTWVEYVSSVDGGQTFATPRRVSAPAEPIPKYFSNPQVVAKPDSGTVHVVYPTGTPDGAWTIRLATSTDGGDSWSRITVNDDLPCANHMIPAMALEPSSGRLHIAWLENRNGHGQVAYTVCTQDGSSCAPNQRISDKPFADYALVRHSPKWVGEYFSLLVDEQNSAVHATWVQPVDEGGQVRARVFHARAPLSSVP